MEINDARRHRSVTDVWTTIRLMAQGALKFKRAFFEVAAGYLRPKD